MRSALNQHDEVMRRLEGRLAGYRNRERLAQNGGEPLRPSDRAGLDSLQRRLPHLHKLSQELHPVAERMLAECQEDAEAPERFWRINPSVLHITYLIF